MHLLGFPKELRAPYLLGRLRQPSFILHEQGVESVQAFTPRRPPKWLARLTTNKAPPGAADCLARHQPTSRNGCLLSSIQSAPRYTSSTPQGQKKATRLRHSRISFPPVAMVTGSLRQVALDNEAVSDKLPWTMRGKQLSA